jgi:hypothetical protein
MGHAQPLHLNRQRVEQLLSRARSSGSTSHRIEILSRHFLGRPYQTDPLIGSAATPEKFTVSLDAFDCVTYVETVLALSRAASAVAFADILRRIRYANGSIAWERRNHYMTGWIRNNVRAGLIQRVSHRNIVSVVKNRTLDAVPGSAPIRTRFSCVPRRAIGKLLSRLHTGDLIFFASTRKHHDVFHCGIVVCDGPNILLRHAARSRGGVVEQALNEFLKANRMAGVIVVRPR